MFVSPFRNEKVVFKREPTLYERWKEFLITQIDEWFIDSIPSDDVKQMPKEYIYPIGMILLLMSIGIFVYIFCSSYVGQVNTRYLSPSDSADSRYCEDISISNSGKYLASKSGQWQSTYGFQYSTAPYVLDIVSFPVTQSAFSDVMWFIFEELNILDGIAKTQDLAINLLIWMTFVYVDPQYLSQRFYLVANPVNVFNRQKTAGAISGITSDCTNNSLAEFDQANGVLKVSYPYQPFMADPTCNNLVNPALMGYTSYANGNQFSSTIDVRTLITAAAVNLGFLDIQALQQITGEVYYFTYLNVTYNATLFSNPQFPDMQPVSCTTHPQPVKCVIILNSIVGFPIFHHVGESTEYPKPCNCSYFQENNISNPEANQTYWLCNSFNFISGMIFYNTTNIAPLYELNAKYTIAEIFENAYYPMYFGSVWGINSPYREWMMSPTNRSKVYDFCYSEIINEYCNFLIFSSFDLQFPSWDISSYYYQLTNGACASSFSTTKDNWNKLIVEPFAPLTQEYVKCRYSPTTVLSNQAGIAVGNVSILMPMGVIIVLACVYYYQVCTGKIIPRCYSKAEKENAAEALAAYLLLAKDGKLELMRKNYLKKKSEERRKRREAAWQDDEILGKEGQAVDDEEEDGINEDTLKLELIHGLVKELCAIAEFGREEYFHLREEELKAETPSINWSAVFAQYRNQSNQENGSQRDRMSSRSKDHSFSSSAVSTLSSANLQEMATEGSIELATVVSSLHNSRKQQFSSKSLQILNQTPISSKIASKYHDLTATIVSWDLLLSDTLPKDVIGRDNTLICLDLRTSSEAGLNRWRMMSERGSNASQSSTISSKERLHTFFAEKELKEANINQSSNANESSLSSRKYCQEVVELLLNYWLPRLEKWCDEFQAHISASESSTAASSSKYWMLSAKMSELQLLKTFTKERIQRFFEAIEALLASPLLITSEDIGMILLVCTLLEKIHCLLSCHGQSALQCSLEILHQKYGNQIGYLIGKEVWSFTELKESLDQSRKYYNDIEEANQRANQEKKDRDS